MTSQERLERIELLKRQAELMKQDLQPDKMPKYYELLKEIAKVQRIEDGYQNIMTFAKNYFEDVPVPHNLLYKETPSPPFHYELVDILRDTILTKGNAHLAIAAPRSHSKSTLASNIVPCWIVAYQQDVQAPFWIIVNAKEDGAKQFLDIIKRTIEDNPAFREDFGDLVGDTWNSTEIITKNNVKIQATGSGGSIRGSRFLNARPNVLIDDLETDQSVATPEQINKTMDYFRKTLLPLGDPNNMKIVYVGTILHYNSCLNQVINEMPNFKAYKYRAIAEFPTNMSLWNDWEEIYNSRNEGSNPMEASRLAREKAMKFYTDNKEAMHEGAVVLWPERMNLLELMEKRVQDRISFLSEYNNEPLDEDTRTFQKIVYYDSKDLPPLEELEIYAAVDPSMGNSKRSDPSVIITVGRARTGIVYVLDVDEKRRNPNQIIKDLFAKAEIYNYTMVSIETVAFQQFFKQEVVKRSAERGLYLPIKEFKSTVKKEIRIASLEPHFSSGIIRISHHQKNLEEQLLYFPKTSHDDIVDALAQVFELCKQGSGRFYFGKL